MVMGPTCGLVLADLGAEVIKVEPVDGDNTRRLTGSGAGFFAAFNRNKKSVAIDVKDPAGHAAVLKLVATADVVTENFRPGAMDKLGLGYDDLRRVKPDLIYVSHKGFLAGPYQDRTALDEVVQMMAGLAYMTGPPGTTSARRRVGQRHHGRHVRRDRRPRGARRAQSHRRGTPHRQRAVRELRAADGAAHDAVRRHRPPGRTDAGARRGLGHLRCLRARRRHAAVPRRRQRLAVAFVLQRAGPRPTGPRRAARHQPAARRGAAVADAPRHRGTAATHGGRTDRPRDDGRPALGADHPPGRPPQRSASAGLRRPRADAPARRQGHAGAVAAAVVERRPPAQAPRSSADRGTHRRSARECRPRPGEIDELVARGVAIRASDHAFPRS